MNANDIVYQARRLGAAITHPPGTGEVLLVAPGVGRVRIQHPRRRKDASRALLGWFRDLESRTVTPTAKVSP